MHKLKRLSIVNSLASKQLATLKGLKIMKNSQIDTLVHYLNTEPRYLEEIQSVAQGTTCPHWHKVASIDVESIVDLYIIAQIIVLNNLNY